LQDSSDLFDWGLHGDSSNLSGGDFELGGRNDLLFAVHFGDAPPHELRGAEAADHGEFEGIATGWASNHWCFLALVRVEPDGAALRKAEKRVYLVDNS
jgi:hypothetical protein